MDLPETRYAGSGDVHIAYQVTGSGPFDLVWVHGFANNIELHWELPGSAQFINRISSFCRLIRFDRRGSGLSDRNVDPGTTLEQRMDDVRAVMDAAGSHRAVLDGLSEGGPMCVMFAATYPARTRALVLCGSYAVSLMRQNMSQEQFDARMGVLRQGWGTGRSASLVSPSSTTDADIRAWGPL